MYLCMRSIGSRTFCPLASAEQKKCAQSEICSYAIDLADSTINNMSWFLAMNRSHGLCHRTFLCLLKMDQEVTTLLTLQMCLRKLGGLMSACLRHFSAWCLLLRRQRYETTIYVSDFGLRKEALMRSNLPRLSYVCKNGETASYFVDLAA